MAEGEYLPIPVHILTDSAVESSLGTSTYSRRIAGMPPVPNKNDIAQFLR